MGSLASSIRSAARATFSAYRRVPIRWRLAGGSAVLTFVILAGFAGMVGALTDRYLRRQFDNDVRTRAETLSGHLNGQLSFGTPKKGSIAPALLCQSIPAQLGDYAEPARAQIRIYDQDSLLCGNSNFEFSEGIQPGAPDFAPPVKVPATYQEAGYRIVTEALSAHGGARFGQLTLLYAEPLSDVEPTLAKVQFVLLLGVLGGTVLALLAGLATAQRAMRPVVRLTEAAREIERTRDPTRHVPHPEAEDEVAELARTLEDMLGALDGARRRMEHMLERQREFVADASHELRTPLTSVLANLELLAEELDGEQAESAGAALRATRRMRRLVGDLLLLARADVKRMPQTRPVDLAAIVTDAAAELGPIADTHVLAVDVAPAVISGVRDDLYRLALNLLQNAVQHTPPGTRITATTASEDATAVVTVQDNGPGIDPELERRVFERFVRGAGDGGRGSGLGLAIVRAVAESHGGAVSLERPAEGGTRFVVRIPQAAPPAAAGNGDGPPQTSTTTGSTIGRRRSRS